MGDPAWELAGGKNTALGTSPQPPALIPQLKAPIFVHPESGSGCVTAWPPMASLCVPWELPEPCGNAGLGDASKVRCLLRNEIGDDATGADKWPVTAL